MLYITDLQGLKNEEKFNELMNSTSPEFLGVQSHIRKIQKENEKNKEKLNEFYSFFNQLGNLIPSKPSIHDSIC